MAWAEQHEYIPAADSATWLARKSARIVYPAIFVYLDWPSGEVRASTHHRNVTIDGTLWNGCGNLAFIDLGAYQTNSAQVTHRVGLSSLPQEAITEEVEAAAIGRRVKLYEGLFDAGWQNPVLHRFFIGHIASAGDFKHSGDAEGNIVTGASIAITNGRNPRQQIENHHSPLTAAAGDTAWRHLPKVGIAYDWPASG